MIRCDGRATTGVAVAFGLAAFAIGAGSNAAYAQMQLPGATNGVAVGQPHRGAEGGPAEPKAEAKPIPVKAPAEDTILGQTLTFDGAKGMMRFNRVGKDVVLGKLTLPGQRLSKPRESCDVDIVPEHPILAIDAGHPAGLTRWSVGVEACPFTLDILDGAALVSSTKPFCDFVAADCRVSPVGLWGPEGDTISAEQVKDLEHQRLRAESTMRSNFRVLLRRAGRDKAAAKVIVGEQAAFSSQREMTCRDYAGETVHGFCSTQITAARSLAILAEFAEREADGGPRKPPHAPAKKRPPKIKAVTPETPAVASAPEKQ